MKNELKQLGLTYNEIRVYESLLVLGKVTVGPILKKLKNMHRQVAYDTLEKLEKKKMIIKTTKNNRGYYKIANPKNILDDIKIQERIAKRLVTEVNKKLKGQKKGQEIKIYEGEKAMRQLFMGKEELRTENSEGYILAGAVDRWTEIVNVSGNLKRIGEIRKRKNTKLKLLYQQKEARKIIKEQHQELEGTKREMRYLNQKNCPPIAVQIHEDSINLLCFGDEPFAIEIKNQTFREAYLGYFKHLWKLGKK